MSFGDTLQARFDRAVKVLGLDNCATRLLHGFVVADIDPDTADARDSYGRQGVQSWDVVLQRMVDVGHSIEEVEQSIDVLSGWNVLQVVGRTASDPIVSGPAALRLTAHGRACVGLAPNGAPGSTQPADAPQPWIVLHGISREGLLREASKTVGRLAWSPLSGRIDSDRGTWLAGQVAARMCGGGAVVIDGFGLPEHSTVLSDLIRRTPHARGHRILVLPDPSPVRVAAVATEAVLRWVEPNAAEGSESGQDLDVSVELRGHQEGSTFADVCGVPGTSIALPRRVQTLWEDLVVPDRVQKQLQQVLRHARFRLEVLPGLTEFKGRGKGYRLLLSGLPGTGKSMAAEALSTSLNRTLVKLDLSSVLSKWLGETEQLIGRIFDMAEAADSVLVLDEAEALFRQRQSGSSGSSALSTAVAFLLTRLERYSGVLVATTNRTQDLDDAFFRRFDDYLVMPMPDVPTRMILWTRMLECGREVDVSQVDFDLLSKRFMLSGGMIRGAAIRANAWSTEHQDVVTMPIVLAALARELEKNDQSNREVFVEPWGRDVAQLLMDDEYLIRSA